MVHREAKMVHWVYTSGLNTLKHLKHPKSDHTRFFSHPPLEITKFCIPGARPGGIGLNKEGNVTTGPQALTTK